MAGFHHSLSHTEKEIGIEEYVALEHSLKSLF